MPLPSWPTSLPPQHRTAPPATIAQVFRLPALSPVTPLIPGIGTGTVVPLALWP